MRKLAFLLILISFSLNGWTQIKEKHTIDSLITKANEQLRNVAFEELIEIAFEIEKRSQKIGYEKGLVKGYSFIMYVLTMSGEYEKGLVYLEKLKKYEDSYFKDNAAELFLFYFDQAEIYYLLGIPGQSSLYFKKAESIIQTEKDDKKRNEGLYYLCTNAHFYSNDPDTNYTYILKAKSFIDDPNFKKDSKDGKTLDYALIYMLIGNYFVEKGKLDSAFIYYTNAQKLCTSIGGHYLEGGIQHGLGNVNKLKNNFDPALAHYMESLKIYEQYNSPEDIRTVYNSLADFYRMNGSISKMNEYLALNSKLTDSLEQKKLKGRDKRILLLINEKEEQVKAADIRQKFTIFLTVGCIIILFAIIFYWVKKHNQKKNKLLIESQKQLNLEKKELEKIESEKKSLIKVIEQKEIENLVLEQKVNVSFDEIMKMAKSNDPLFWKRFQEVYPHFLNKLISINPDFRTSELIICAYIYLGFTSKEFAEYTFKSAKTVENYRYNIRKKLHLNTQDDLKIWLQSYIDK